MNDSNVKFLFFKIHFAESEQAFRHKIVFLYSVSLTTAVLFACMAFFRILTQNVPLLGYFDIAFSGLILIGLIFLNRHKEKYEVVASTLLSLAFVIFFAVYVLAPYPVRIALFFPLVAAAFFLKGRRAGRLWLASIVVAMVGGSFLSDFARRYSPMFAPAYPLFDIVTTCLYLAVLFFILENYELYKDDQHRLQEEQEILQRTEERWRLALEGAGDAVWDWDIRTDEFHYSKRLAEMLGYGEHELGHRRKRILSPLHPEDRSRLEVEFAACAKPGASRLAIECRVSIKGGGWMWVLARGRVTDYGADGHPRRMAGTITDITERKEAEAALARLSHWNELLLSSAGEGIYGVDAQGLCTFMNPSALAMLGLEPEEALGANLHSLFHYHHRDGTPYPEADCPTFLTLRDGIQRRVEDSFIRKNGETFPVQMTVTPMLEDGQVRGAEVVFEDISRRKAMEAELLRLATTDPLTGAANRRRFLEQMEMELARVKRHGKSAALLMVDIDHFKEVNDAFGHSVGDSVIQHLAELARKRLRRSDLFARLGGEEFGILLPETEGADAHEFADLFRRQVIEAPAQSAKGAISITISIGVSEFDPSDASPDMVLARADNALYRAKEGGRNRVETEPPPI
jgi:diguanylate cyclase (GGDEF)-like protein/PAS domain S-box-containing protein